MNKNKGFSLIELMVVVALVGIITTLAIPAFGDMMQRNKLKTAVQSFQDDMQFAHTQAIKRSVSVIVSRITGSSGNWCYGLTTKIPSTKTSCDCTVTTTTATNYCDIKIVLGTGFSTVSMATEAGNNSTFDFRRGTIGNDGVTFYTTNYAARVVFDAVGRVRTCAPTTYPTGTIALPNLKC